MKRICYIVAMENEAQPLVDHYGAVRQEGFFAPLPCLLYTARVKDSDLFIVVNGKQHGTSLVGCEAASIATTVAIERLRPDIVLSSGTCGAWKKWGMSVGEVYLADGVMFHDRRVPGDDEYFTQTLGHYPLWEGTAALARELGLKTAKVTTGSSFDLSKDEEETIETNGGRLKEMEGAAVAFACSLFGVPVMLVKAVTDLCDDTATNYKQFLRNLALATEALRCANERIIERLSE